MRTRLAIAALVAVGVLLMANPLYLPVAVGEPDPAYTHTAQPVDDGSPVVDAEPAAVDDATVAYADLDQDARDAFDRARESPENSFAVEDPSDRVDSLSYPADPVLGDGLLVVVYEGDRYEFWTRTIERESGPVVAQRVAVQPVVFLVGFLGVVAAAGLAMRGRLGVDGDETDTDDGDDIDCDVGDDIDRDVGDDIDRGGGDDRRGERR